MACSLCGVRGLDIPCSAHIGTGSQTYENQRSKRVTVASLTSESRRLRTSCWMLSSVRTAAVLLDAAQRELRARPAQPASAIKRPGPGRRGPPANPPWRSMTQRRPGCRRPACAQSLTRCSQARSVARYYPGSRRQYPGQSRAIPVRTRHSWWLTGRQSHVSIPARDVSTPTTHAVSFAPTESVPHGSQAVVTPC
jgi:hypothetical protein